MHPEARILYMSGYSHGATSSGRLLEEGVMFIQKPFTVHGLLKRVEDMLTGSTEQSTDTGEPRI
jgi:two-component system cell cycle sensor histidine kinase/response regulator CckA